MDRTFDPRHLDVLAFAQAQARLQDQSPLAQWSRLHDEHTAAATPQQTTVHWQLQGRMLSLAGGGEQVGLYLQAQVDLPMQCQRCLGPVQQAVHAQRDFLFVADEATALALDDETEEDVLVLSRDFDALALVEDELILALPLVPRHEVCPHSLPSAAQDQDFEAHSQRPHPFAALAALNLKPSERSD